VRVDQWWTVGPYRLEEVVDHPFDKITSGPMYRYAINGKISSEMFESLDRAIVAAVGERHMGPRGAGGNAVGTAADWFCKMIDLDEAEAEQAPAASAQAVPCSGRRGKSWTTHTPGPACPVCLQGPGDLDAEKPVWLKTTKSWSTLVPDHELIPL
jgi:hypothetical protein